jgi:ketosteroid isomerase-like protein
MTTPRALWFAIVIGLVAGGCKAKQEEAAGKGTGTAAATGTGAGTGAATGTGTAPGPAADDALPAAAKIDDAAVHKLVDAWLAAQNGGDFAAYQALYADKMEGVKRVGPQTWRFDRAGWLGDRERMFKHPMVVTAGAIAIHGSATAPSVELVQGFKQGKFADEGPKHLALIKGPNGFLIAREEMLLSTVAGAVPAGSPTVMLVVEVDGHQHVVINTDADAAWGKGRIAGPFAGMHQFAMQDASGATGAAAWQGRALAVYAADGTRCDATVGALRLLGGGSPHFGEMQAWNNDPDMGDGHVWSRAERARAIFEMGSLYLVGELAITGACKPVLAAEPSATPKLQPDGGAVDPALAEAARTAFRKLPGYADLQRSFVDDFASEGSGCGDFLGQLVAIYEVRAGKPVLVSNPTEYLRVDAILDSDGDGKIELIGAPEDFSTVTAHLTPDGDGGFTPAAAVSFPFNDCGC